MPPMAPDPPLPQPQPHHTVMLGEISPPTDSLRRRSGAVLCNIKHTVVAVEVFAHSAQLDGFEIASHRLDLPF
jgi:hypothetical protein